MKAIQLVCGVALAVALPACRETVTQADANKVKGVASGVTDEAKKVAAKTADELADGWLTTKIQSKFVADREIKATEIKVSSHRGVVTLEGQVQSESMRSLAVAIAQNTGGVKQVVNQLSVMVAAPPQPGRVANADGPVAVATTGALTPDRAARPDDASITTRIQAKYFLDDKVKARRIEVNSNNGIVILRGDVHNDDERAQALLLARTTAGVERVEDNLTVTIEQPSAVPSLLEESVAPGLTGQAARTGGADDSALTARVQTTLSADIDEESLLG